jgi:hypothetical protein
LEETLAGDKPPSDSECKELGDGAWWLDGATAWFARCFFGGNLYRGAGGGVPPLVSALVSAQ